MYRYLPIIICLLLTGCATSFNTFADAWPYLTGQHIKVAIDYLGIPDGEYTVAGRKVYVWNTTGTNPFPTVVTTNTDGNIGNQQIHATSKSYQYDSRTLGCEIKIATEDEIIKRFEFDGNNGPCYKFSDRLIPLIQANEQN